jgi:tetratricopeptide (TPR) repeat protein
LARIFLLQNDGDLIKPEELARKSLRIRDQLWGSNSFEVSENYLLLARILRKQNKFRDETSELFERSLATLNPAAGNRYMGRYYYKLAMIQSTVGINRTQLLLAKPSVEEALRMKREALDSTHPSCVSTASLLSMILDELLNI